MQDYRFNYIAKICMFGFIWWRKVSPSIYRKFLNFLDVILSVLQAIGHQLTIILYLTLYLNLEKIQVRPKINQCLQHINHFEFFLSTLVILLSVFSYLIPTQYTLCSHLRCTYLSWEYFRSIAASQQTILGKDISPETMQKLCLFTKFPHQKIRWSYSILRSSHSSVFIVKYEHISHIFSVFL